MPIVCIVGAVACFLSAVTLNEIEVEAIWIYGLLFWGSVLSIMAMRVE